MDYAKTHSAPKRVLPRGDELAALVLETNRIIAEVVGGTLGPGGQPVLIERADDLPPTVTKDGVSVFKAMGFPDSVMQAIMESTRDVAIRTANEAGDGTTSSVIVAEAIVRLTYAFHRRNPGYSPHRVIRELEAALRDHVVPRLKALAVPVSLDVDQAGKDKPTRRIARQVARVSANSDDQLADVVMQCFDICGDEGNITLAERIGIHGYEVEEVQGYPMPVGYEDSCGPFYTEFLREPAAHRTVMKAPLWILYHGEIRELSTLEDTLAALMAKEGTWGQSEEDRDIVLVTCGYSDSVLGQLAVNWKTPRMSRIFPLKVPLSGFQGGRKAFLEDLASVVGAEVYDPMTNPLGRITYAGVGAAGAVEETADGPGVVWRGRTESAQIGRRWTAVLGYADPEGEEIMLRVEELKAALPAAVSKMEAMELTERIARLSGGIARLTIVGTSNGDTKERKDRAEDAVCAVKGALKHGALYGGCWGLLQVARELAERLDAKAVQEVLVPALRAPFTRLLQNIGILDENALTGYRMVVEAKPTRKDPIRVFDALELKLVDPEKAGIYDSVPAVVEAIRSSLSIAMLHGTLGGAIVYARNRDLELSEAQAEQRTKRLIRNVNEMYTDGGAMLPPTEES